jgi:hypothetical protein
MPRRAIPKQINELKIVKMYSDSDSSLVLVCIWYRNPSAEKFKLFKKNFLDTYSSNETGQIDPPTLKMCFLHGTESTIYGTERIFHFF